MILMYQPDSRYLVYRADRGVLSVQDYHVIFMYQPDSRCLVYDMDSELPFPTYFHKYVTETFRTDHILHPEHHRWVTSLTDTRSEGSAHGSWWIRGQVTVGGWSGRGLQQVRGRVTGHGRSEVRSRVMTGQRPGHVS